MLEGKKVSYFVVGVAMMVLVLGGCSTRKHAAVMGGEAAGQPVGMGKGVAEAEKPGIPLSEGGISQESMEERAVPEPAPPVAKQMEQAPLFLPQAPPAPTFPEEKPVEAPQPEAVAKLPRDLGKPGEEGTSQLTFSGAGPEIKGTQAEIVPPSESGPTVPEMKFTPQPPPLPSTPKEEETVVREMPITQEPVESGYEGREFAKTLKPSDFVPEPPPQPSRQEPSFQAMPSPIPVPAPAVEPVPPPVEAVAPKAVEEMPPSLPVVPEMKKEEPVALPEPEEKIEPLAMLPGETPVERPVIAGDLHDVFFDFDKYAIRSDAVPTLEKNAKLLASKFQHSRVVIQGHCDERGTNEYNLVLGERRAHAAKRYLMDLGVPDGRIETISYGEERPFCTESNPSCWQQNRRGHFVVE